MKGIKTCLILLLALFFSLQLLAQSAQYRFAHLNIRNGLSHNQVNSILKDSRGFMWFGTASGLNRFNGYGFTVFKHNIDDSTSLQDNFILQLLEDSEGRIWVESRAGFTIYLPKTNRFLRHPQALLKQYALPDTRLKTFIRDKKGRYWFAHSNMGLYSYNPVDSSHKRYHLLKGKPQSLQSDSIAWIAEGIKGSIWIIHPNGLLEKLDTETGNIVLKDPYLSSVNPGKQADYQLFVDKDGGLWIFSAGTAKGLYHFRPADKKWLHLSKEDGPVRLKNDIVNSVTQDGEGNIWVGTDHGGVHVLSLNPLGLKQLLSRPDNERTLSQNSINTLYRDSNGTIWIGTYKRGIDYYHKDLFAFPLFKHAPSVVKSLPFEDVNCFVEDALGNIWIGTNGGGLLMFNRRQNRFHQYTHQSDDPHSLSNNVIVSLCIDHKGQLWAGTYFGGLNRFDGKRFHHYKHQPDKAASLSDNRVYTIFEDSKQRLWVGTLDGGLNLLNPKTGLFKHYRKSFSDFALLHSDYIADMLEDRKGNLWIATSEGIDVISSSGKKIRHFGADESRSGSLSNNNVIVLKQDSRGWIWAGTREGLNLYHPETQSFTAFRTENGLPDNTVLTLLEDAGGNMWMSTPNGLSLLQVSFPNGHGSPLFTFRNFDESDGLQGKEFNENAAMRLSSGELIFGGPNGFNLFDPQKIEVSLRKAPLYLSDIKLFNNSVKVGDTIKKRVLLTQSLWATKKITVKHSQDMLSLEFAALSYLHPEKIEYVYRMEGFSDQWLNTDAEHRVVTYTNLDAGDYIFIVKARYNNAWLHERELRLKISVLPPFWETPLAYFLYLLVLVGLLLLARKIILERERMKFRLQQERLEAQRLHELDRMKIHFFTNVSHEFRTPLSLILSPLDKLVKEPLPGTANQSIALVHRNARRLLNLVNQLLDFRRIEVNEMSLSPVYGDIVQFSREVMDSFSDISENKHISLHFNTEVQELNMCFDPDKWEKILFNLLSNAFKFTPEKGSVTVSMALTIDNNQQLLSLSVRDTGIGIDPEMKMNIFKRFFQSPRSSSLVNPGSGIGLSITKEFVRLHDGEITVESNIGKGSVFIIHIPVKSNPGDCPKSGFSGNKPPILPLYVPKITEPGQETPTNLPVLPVLLLVEDHEDFRFYLKDNLKHTFNILEARNGKEAWELAQKELPDLIVSDVMMPELDGKTLCKLVKNDSQTSHIPVILLTALSDEEQELEGLQTGADDYVSKPFNFELLLSRMVNLLRQRELMRQELQQKIALNPKEIIITDLDEQFINKAIELVEVQMGNAHFSVEDFGKGMNLSRVALYKKLLALTGKSPSEFIRTLRLKRSVQLLCESQLGISEIAYQVGFNSPKIFTKYFKGAYGVPPSQYPRKKNH